MDMRQLRYFVGVAEHRNFHRAAEALNVAQSALSRHISQLELHFGAPLLDRTSRGINLTALGGAFYPEAKYLLERFDSMVGRTKSAVDGHIGQLSIAVLDVGAHPVLAPCIARFRDLHPRVQLNFTKTSNDDQPREIRAGRLDAGVMFAMPGKIRDVAQITLATTTMMLALHQNHRLAPFEEIDARALDDERFINVDPVGHSQLYADVSSHCAAAGLKLRYLVDAASERMQLSLIREGMGVGLVLSSSMGDLPEGIVLRQVKGLDLNLEINLIWSASSPSPYLRDFSRMVSNAMKNVDSTIRSR